jgi:protein-tyrosine phosphatase
MRDGTGPTYLNFRDLGGVAAAEGFVARGRLFRTAHLSEIDDASAHHLVETLRIGSYLDFRADFEVLRDGTPTPLLARGVQWLRHPFDIAHATFRSSRRPNSSDWSGLYGRAFRRLEPVFSDAIRLIAKADAPIVFGCWVGKDRTGMVAALVLSLLGVSDELISIDYGRTTHSLAPHKTRFELLWQNEPEAADAIFEAYGVAKPEVMVGFLRALRDDFGSIQSALGLTSAELDSLKSRYVVERDGAD